MKRIFGQIIIILAHSENLPLRVKTMLDVGETVLKNKKVFFIKTNLHYGPISLISPSLKIDYLIHELAAPVQDE
jgi:hypothetical protein